MRQEYTKPADSEAFQAALSAVEEWLYEEGEDQAKKVGWACALLKGQAAAG
jgi:hypothetical protein